MGITSYDREFLLSLFDRMVLIREFEERVRFLFLEGSMPGTIHQCQGQEAAAVGVCAALGPDDYITSTHRPHGHALAKGLTPDEVMMELYGGTTGCCKGKGGSMHVGNMNKGMVPAIAIVGGGIPIAAGMALAFKMQRTGQVAACFFGDGATSEGAFHEAINMAAIWDLPVVFVCENNLYGASTHVEKVTRLKHLAEKVDAYGMHGVTVDGNDLLAVLEASRKAVADCRDGNGPAFLELETYRRCGHSRRDPNHYQVRDEQQTWLDRDPIELFAGKLRARPDVADADLDAVRASVEARVEGAVDAGRNAPQPTMEDLMTDVFA